MSTSPAKDLSQFFKLAKNECCNYTPTGPFQQKHYCCLEPRQSDHQCMLYRDLACRWFVEAVLPRDEVLLAEWNRVRLHGADPELALELLRTCQCGKRFKVKSNRQRLCPECAKENRKKLTRNGMRRRRAKG